jgi:TRAP-type uncharacterized transport system substrate-binding protein
MSKRERPFAIWLFVLMLLAAMVSQTSSTAAQAPKQPPIPAQLPGIGIAAKKPVLGGACKICPWGVVADVVKKAMKPYGHDVQVCYFCAGGDAPRIVAEARMPPPLPSSENEGMRSIAPFVPPQPNGRVEFGVTTVRNVVAAYRGTGQYAQDGPRPNLRLLATVNSPLYILAAVKPSTGITDLAQLKDYSGPPLKIVTANDIAEVVLPYYGTSMDALKAKGATFVTPALPQSRARPDIILLHGNLSNSPEFNIWYDESQHQDLRFLQFPEPLIEKMVRELNLERGEAPVGLFRGMNASIPTVVRTGTAVYGRTDMPDSFAYLVAKALDEQQDLFQWTIGEYSYNRYRVTKAGEVPLHPGAARYYRERGYLK